MLSPYQKDFAAWFQEFPFELFVTVRLPHDFLKREANQLYTKEVLQPMSSFVGDKIAGFTVIVPRTPTEQQHIHALLLSKNRTLKAKAEDLKTFFAEKDRGELLNHCNAIDIQSIYDLPGVCHYVAKPMKNPATELREYRDRLLHQKRGQK